MTKTALLLMSLVITLISSSQVTTITPEIKGSGGLSMDSDGNIYIGDFGDYLSMGDLDGLLNKVYKLDTEGNITVYAEGFVGASGNAFNSEGILFQADIGASTIYKIVDGIPEVFVTENISNPVGIVFDEEDNMFVCNCGSNTIARVTPEGESSIYSAGEIFNCPNGITIDHEGVLYVSNFSNGNILKIPLPGEPTFLATIPGLNNGHLRYCPADSMIYICSHGSSSIYEMSVYGDVHLFAGSGVRGNDDGPWDEASFSRPNGIVFSTTGDTMYVNSSIPVTDEDFPLNPSVIRQISGVKTGVLQISDVLVKPADVEVYPNPSVDGVVTVSADQVMVIDVYTVQGKLVQSYALEDKHVVIDYSQHPGVYLLEIRLENGQIHREKVIFGK